MPHYICTTCGTQFAESDAPPSECVICNDERQYLKTTGQLWTTLDRINLTNRISIRYKEQGLMGIGLDPHFAIGQRALFLRTPDGNVLWDCIPAFDHATIEMVNALGGLQAIAISHPHFYASMVEWSHAFGDIPIYLHAADKQWIMRPDKRIVSWEGETLRLFDGVTLIRCGGHFAGGAVLHWDDGAQGKGILLSGDIIQVVADRKHVSFMYSYPNSIPLPVRTIQQIVNAVAPFPYERIYGGFWDMVIDRDATTFVQRSADRYIKAISP